MPAHDRRRESNSRHTQPFISRRPHHQTASLTTSPQNLQVPLPRDNHPVYPAIATPIPTPVLQPFIPLQIHSDSSTGTLKLTGQIHQPFLPEVLYLSLGLPTWNTAKLQAFVNYCRFILESHRQWVINHSITKLHEITPAPAIFAGHLQRYRITISIEGSLEDYWIIAWTASLPIYAALQHAFTVFYDWQSSRYTISINEWTSGKSVKSISQ